MTTTPAWAHYTTKLARCPFCGGEPRGIFGEPGSLFIECQGDVDGEPCPDVHYPWLDTKEEVAKAYNRRPQVPPPSALPSEETP